MHINAVLIFVGYIVALVDSSIIYHLALDVIIE